MPVLHVNEQQYPLTPGTTRLGSAGAAEVPLAGSTGIEAIIDVDAGSAVIRRAASDAAVRVNGVALGAEPTPLLHGDRVEIGGIELRFADDQKAGATQFVSANDIAAMAGRRAGPSVATRGTGGRLVSLVDGKEYVIPEAGLVIGREVGADVVVPLSEVSRRHAEILASADGYRLTDLSTNGVLVNGERVDQSRVLVRSDVIRIGAEEFRFYADVAARPVTPPPAVAVAPAPVVADPVVAPVAEAAAEPARSLPPVLAPPTRPAPVAPRPPADVPAPAAPVKERAATPAWPWLVVLLIAAVVAFAVLR